MHSHMIDSLVYNLKKGNVHTLSCHNNSFFILNCRQWPLTVLFFKCPIRNYAHAISSVMLLSCEISVEMISFSV